MRAWLVVALAGCGFQHGAASGGPTDAPPDVTDALHDTPGDGKVFMDGPPLQPITFVQENSVGPGVGADTIAAQYLMPQSAHDLNVVVVSWNTLGASCNGVTDLAGNTYVRVDMVVASTGQKMDVFYAKDIASALAANLVSATFSSSVSSPEIRILEYSGLDTTAPLDVTGEATGTNSKNVSSGAVATAHAYDLIIGAEISQDTIKNPGPNFTTRTTTGGDLVEDEVVTTAGAYDATATLMNNTTWIMRMIAFKGVP